MEKQKNIPQLRFPEFDGEWKIEATGNYIDLISGYAFKGDEISEDSDGIPILRGINITEGVIRHSDDIDRYFSGDISQLKKYLLKKGDIVLGMDGSKVGKNVAIISAQDENSLLIQRVAKINSNPKSDYRFIFQRIFSSIFHQYVDVVNTSSGIPHISLQQIRDFKVGYPTLSEQQKIAFFFTAIDQKILQLKQKKFLLEQYKKGVMQKIFSQEIRFKDENGQGFPRWEKKKLGEIGTVQMCKRIFANQTEESGEVPFYKIGTLGSLANAYISRELFNTYKSKYNYPKEGHTLITCSGTVGKCVQFDGHDSYYQDSNIVWIDNTDKNVSNDFLFLLLSNYKWDKLNSTTITRIYTSDLKVLQFRFPTLKEQQKITEFLSAINSKICYTQIWIEKAELWKKGLLQNMFV
jgi:type I restriction enzyme S subunit